VLEALLVVMEDVGVLAQQAQRLAEEVVEVHAAGAEQAVLVLAEDVGDLALEQVAGALGVGLGVDAVVLGRADGGVDRAGWEALGVEAQVADDVAGEPDGVGLVVDGERAGKPSLSASRRRMRTQAEWNVDTHILDATGPTSAATRDFISSAALFVNVMARISKGLTPPRG
jgi:hypothetical protein